MPDDFTIDTSEARTLGVDVGRMPAKAVPEGDAVLEKGAVELKKGMVDAFKGSPHFKGVARDVSYERRGFARELGYEIGPEVGLGERHGGGLGGIAVDGGANGGGGSVDIDGLLEPEARQVEKFLGDVLEGLL